MIAGASGDGAREGWDRELDLTGDVCPYTFIKAKLVLEEMGPGEVLRVLVDYAPSTQSVPRSMRLHGEEPLDVSPLGDGRWAIRIRRRTPA